MIDEEQAIRKLIETWMSASKSGDTETILNLMTEDVIFMIPGQEPFGKEAFRKASEKNKDMRIEGESEIKEINVLGDWAYLRTYLDIKITKQDDTTIHKSGYTLTILRKEDGQWKLARDANLLTEES